MLIGHRWRELREQAKLSQGEMAERTGFLQGYVSDVESGRSVPSIEAFRKVARALQIPIDWLFYDGENPPALVSLPKRKAAIASDGSGEHARWLARLRRALNDAASKSDRKLMTSVIQNLTKAESD
jgi:transcriptional regulator with XRE-family HTH domain